MVQGVSEKYHEYNANLHFLKIPKHYFLHASEIHVEHFTPDNFEADETLYAQIWSQDAQFPGS